MLSWAVIAVTGGLFHLVNHSVFKSLLFLVSGAVEHIRGTRQLKDLGGILKTNPVTGWTGVIASLSISGIPPFNGFFSKLLIIAAAIGAGFYVTGILTIFVSFVTLLSFIKVQKYVVLGEPGEQKGEITRPGFTMGLSMVILSILCLITVLLLVGPAYNNILKPASETVLGGVNNYLTLTGIIQ